MKPAFARVASVGEQAPGFRAAGTVCVLN
jgi:hypothetical protein